MGAVGGRFGNFGVYLVIVLQLGHLEHFVIRPVEDVRHERLMWKMLQRLPFP